MGKPYFLTEEKVRGILLSGGKTAEGIAERFGVSVYSVFLYKRLLIKRARTVAAALRTEGFEPLLWPRYSGAHRARFTPEQVAEIRASKEPSSVFAKRYGCARSTIRMMRTGRTYRGV